MALERIEGVPLSFELAEPLDPIGYGRPAHTHFNGQTVTLYRGEAGGAHAQDRDRLRVLGGLANHGPAA